MSVAGNHFIPHLVKGDRTASPTLGPSNKTNSKPQRDRNKAKGPKELLKNKKKCFFLPTCQGPNREGFEEIKKRGSCPLKAPSHQRQRRKETTGVAGEKSSHNDSTRKIPPRVKFRGIPIGRGRRSTGTVTAKQQNMSRDSTGTENRRRNI